mmetsp:Transcript_22915/g.32801  ORF Transcript_22915/g.32801 Transcript_22915/m.32801 type:complete len:98 (-) Transcript_22915:139-432(-)|eukprot:CAMPEP_0202467714 /NCGR_PEP_ID=MMETSP1360-20130828/73102_1 /ASSEMBLY_ACC=CAM_ASM_000848 /TAXON_ID=515479 /ORGANISM="Licmophora paradoxa, Strain CCMP2313" /LENGTH=97 /DNA_ID=CAMNT_0049092389 /DNA_START=141 /DNA_END=434 /DNA_ORIENTATION=-
MLAGGHTEAKDATDSIKEKVIRLKADAEAKTGRSFERFDATHYRSQVVAGTMWHFKVSISITESVHMKVIEPLPYTKEPMKIIAITVTRAEEDLGIM